MTEGFLGSFGLFYHINNIVIIYLLGLKKVKRQHIIETMKGVSGGSFLDKKFLIYFLSSRS